ncbi:MAG TPA: MFS transporter [Opitutaceae bacterium]|jgi:ACS family hexuronate transporter-like MFS transporter|nr:MFS transporter [Opitutaceae bacterium]
MIAAASSAAAGPTFGSSRLGWVMIAFAFGATVINYLDRQTLSVAAPILTQEFRMNDETSGLILVAFMLAYTIMNGLSGPFIDRVGTKLGYACCMAWWATASLLHMFARGPLSLGAFRFLLGVGEAGNWPAAVKLVSEWFSAKERALASGIFNSGAAIGAVAAPPLISWIVLRWGWQRAFAATGALGYVWLIGWWSIYRVPAPAAHVAPEQRIPVLQLLRTRFVPSFTLAKAFLDPVYRDQAERLDAARLLSRRN